MTEKSVLRISYDSLIGLNMYGISTSEKKIERPLTLYIDTLQFTQTCVWLFEVLKLVIA